MGLSIERRIDIPQDTEHIGQTPHVAVVGVGKVGRAFLRPEINANVTALTRRSGGDFEGAVGHVDNFDITGNIKELADTLTRLKANGVRSVINTAGLINANTPRPRANPEASDTYRANVLGAQNLALACKQAGLGLIHISTVSVFGTDREELYTEKDQPDMNPPFIVAPTKDRKGRALNFYGETKYRSEQAVSQAHPEGTVVLRMGGIQGPEGGLFAFALKELLSDVPSFTKVNDVPMTHLTDVETAKAILAVEERMHKPNAYVPLEPLYNITGEGTMTPLAVTQLMAAKLEDLGIRTVPVHGISQDEFEAKQETAGAIVIPRSREVNLNPGLFGEHFYRLPTTAQEVEKYVELYLPLFRHSDQ